MSKRNYTHVKELLPAIRGMVEQGKTQQEIAEHYGLKDKMVVSDFWNGSAGRQGTRVSQGVENRPNTSRVQVRE